MKTQKKAMIKAAELLEATANCMRQTTLVWNGHAYAWPASARAVKRLHDNALDQAGKLREMAR